MGGTPQSPPWATDSARRLVRLSPLLLGQIGEAAQSIVQGSLIVQFCGHSVRYNEEVEWNVTHAIVSNSLAVSSPERRTKRNEEVDKVMHAQSLTHVGWLRQASASCPLSMLDLDTQRVYEAHLPDAFAAMLDLAPEGVPLASGPMVYFYCLADPQAAKGDAAYNAFIPAQHVILDTSVPFTVVRILFGEAAVKRSESGDCTRLPQPYEVSSAPRLAIRSSGVEAKGGIAGEPERGSQRSASNGTSQTTMQMCDGTDFSLEHMSVEEELLAYGTY